MSCQTVPEDNYAVVIKFTKPLRTRCVEYRNNCHCLFCTFLVLSIFFVVFGLVWVLASCQSPPGMSLEAMSVHDMQLYQNNTLPSSQSPWQLNSRFSVRLSTWNPNTVAGCFCTFRRVIVRVEYRGQVILQQEVPLGFGLKPQRSRPASFNIQGDGIQLKNPDLGPLMEKELRSDNISLDVYFDARYMQNDRLPFWLNMGCHVVAKTPMSNSSSVGVANSLLNQDCTGIRYP